MDNPASPDRTEDSTPVHDFGPAERSALEEAAHGILEGNWTGTETVPSRTVYPHQWSWDSAFITIGRSHYRQDRAQQELETLLASQWTTGMVPHIVFNPKVPADAYFPGPDFWEATRADGHPGGPATSGITQPPLHARAALEVYRHATDRDEALAFLGRLYPKLVAQHDYLATRRDPGGRGLAAIVHPWESGTDNSPLWDRELADMEIPPGALPSYRRHDLDHVDRADRPSDAAYDRFVYLAITYRDSGYDDGYMVRESPFLFEAPLFNAIWCWSAHALAEIAELLGKDPGPQRDLAARIHHGLLTHLWDPDDHRFHAYDLHERRIVRKQTIASLLPLLDPGLPGDVTEALLSLLDSPHFHDREHEQHFLVPTYDLRSPDFDRRRYWRGPIWMNTNWLLWRGLRQHGNPPVTRELMTSNLRLAQQSGFREYFDPFTGAGYGSREFSWTAALVVDQLRSMDGG